MEKYKQAANTRFNTHLKRSTRNMGSTIMTMPSLLTSRPRTPAPSYQSASTIPSPAIKKNQFKIRLANMHDIQREASMLIQERYAQRGYDVQTLDADPNRLTIVAFDGMDPIGTLSIGFDSPTGLLCDELYPAEMGTLRASGRKLCEFIKFAAVSSPSSIKTLATLFHVAFIYAHRIHGFDEVVIEVNPHHLKFYQRALNFQQVGPERLNPRVNAPAVLLRGDFVHIGQQIRKFGGNPAGRKEEKSIYPYGFSEREEQGILQRLEAMAVAHS